VVVEAGPGVEHLREGDHVVLALVPSCGECSTCRRGRPTFCELFGQCASDGVLADGTSRLSVDGTTLHHFNSVSSFAEYAVVPESAAVAVRRDVLLQAAALVSCAVVTGFGAVANTAEVEEGATVAVWGCGGVGLNVVQAARLVAVDTRQKMLELARRLGATDAVRAGEGVHTAAVVQELVPGGVDYAFEAVGREATINEAWAAVRSGGTVVVVGLMPKDSTLTIDPWGFINEKTLKGCFLGTARIERDIPHLVDLAHEGKLELEGLVSRRIRLQELPEAFERLRAGEAARQLVVFD
jgi:S-(hydroxymethyl)glutathione dehydrogenase/alcohol dehydrogenase